MFLNRAEKDRLYNCRLFLFNDLLVIATEPQIHAPVAQAIARINAGTDHDLRFREKIDLLNIESAVPCFCEGPGMCGRVGKEFMLMCSCCAS